jgi:hypothetical protein
LAREQYYLDLIRPYYNLLTEAGSSLGYSATPETRAKMSASQGTALYAFTASAKDPQLTFSSMRKAAAHFQCSRGTILNHVQSGLLFKNQWLLSFKAILSPEEWQDPKRAAFKLGQPKDPHTGTLLRLERK